MDQLLSSRELMRWGGGSVTAGLPTGAGRGMGQGFCQQSSLKPSRRLGGAAAAMGGPVGGQGRPALEGSGGALGGRGTVTLTVWFFSTSSRHCTGTVEAAGRGKDNRCF